MEYSISQVWLKTILYRISMCHIDAVFKPYCSDNEAGETKLFQRTSFTQERGRAHIDAILPQNAPQISRLLGVTFLLHFVSKDHWFYRRFFLLSLLLAIGFLFRRSCSNYPNLLNRSCIIPLGIPPEDVTRGYSSSHLPYFSTLTRCRYPLADHSGLD